jgi:hypothetical protein
MCPKMGNGAFTSRFDAVEWGRGYTEGNAWHHSFPPYAISPHVPPLKLPLPRHRARTDTGTGTSTDTGTGTGASAGAGAGAGAGTGAGAGGWSGSAGGFAGSRLTGGSAADSAVGHLGPPGLTSLSTLHGGNSQLLFKLHSLLTTQSNFRTGSYGQEIHEMTEMRAGAMGQYGHNNQVR